MITKKETAHLSPDKRTKTEEDAPKPLFHIQWMCWEGIATELNDDHLGREDGKTRKFEEQGHKTNSQKHPN